MEEDKFELSPNSSKHSLTIESNSYTFEPDVTETVNDFQSKRSSNPPSETEEFEVQSEDILDANFDDQTNREKLTARLTELQLENRIIEARSSIINKELFRYFKKNKVDRALVQGPTEPHSATLEKQYNLMLRNYQDELSYKDEVFQDCEKNIQDTEEIFENAEKNFQDLFTGFEKKLIEIGTTLIGAKSGTLLSLRKIKQILRKQRNARSTLMDIRKHYQFLVKKTDLMEKKSQQMNDIGGGLRVADFEQLRAEITNLSNQIEKRTNDLNRSRIRGEGETQQLAHIREKSFLLTDDVTFKINQRDQTKQTQARTREMVGKLKLKLITNRRNYDDLVRSGGLLTNNDLLYDFDDIKEDIENLEKENEVLVDKKIDLQEKIKNLTEKKLSKKNSGSNSSLTSFKGKNQLCFSLINDDADMSFLHE